VHGNNCIVGKKSEKNGSLPHDFTFPDYVDMTVDYGLQPNEKLNWVHYRGRRHVDLELHDTCSVPESYKGRLSIPTLNMYCDT
jgi:hypothetical protein